MNKLAYFYLLTEKDELNLSICKIIKEYYNKKNKILVCSYDAELIDNINKLLWTFEQLTFIPHCTNAQYDKEAMVLLYDYNYINDSIMKKDYNVVLNLCYDENCKYEEHEIILEIVRSTEEEKILSRQKYLYYKKNNLEVRHISL